jgi:hypothetical protein
LQRNSCPKKREKTFASEGALRSAAMAGLSEDDRRVACGHLPRFSQDRQFGAFRIDLDVNIIALRGDEVIPISQSTVSLVTLSRLSLSLAVPLKPRPRRRHGEPAPRLGSVSSRLE